MIDKLLFDNWDPWVTELRRDSHGRFAGGGGGGTRAIKPGRKGNWGTHTQRVTGYDVKGKKRYSSVTSTTRSLRAGKGKRTKAYVYKIGKNGRVEKNPTKNASRIVSGQTGKGRFRPGSPLGSKNVRFVSRGHMRARVIGGPGSLERGLGRLHSRVVARQAIKRGRLMSPGYVVSYGKPIGK